MPEILLARHRVHDDARGVLQAVGDERMNGRRRHRVVAREILRQVVRVADVLVVRVEAIGDAAEAALLLERLDHVRLECVARAIDFRLFGRRRAQLVQFLVGGFFELVGGVARAAR